MTLKGFAVAALLLWSHDLNFQCSMTFLAISQSFACGGESKGVGKGREEGRKIYNTPCQLHIRKLNGETGRKLEIVPAPLFFACPW